LKRSEKTRLLIADDHSLVREGLRTMLVKEEDLEVTGEAENGRQAVEMCRSLDPDLVLMDVRMPKMDGLAATRAIKDEQPGVAVLIITTYENPDYLFEAIKAGAAGYVLKDATRVQLLEAVRRVISGESPLNEKLSMQLLQRLAEEGSEVPGPVPVAADPTEYSLTEREVEVLKLMSGGNTNREIAAELFISAGTVKSHVQHIIAKLGASDRTQAAVMANRIGLLS
jgi:DNA-binding NarL/FixJ family response regulator